MRLVGACYICGAPAMNTCSSCGRLVCRSCYRVETGTCVKCSGIRFGGGEDQESYEGEEEYGDFDEES